MIAVHPLIGRRVLRVYSPTETGVITKVHAGCNALVEVRFDGRDRDHFMVPNDLAFVELWPGENCRVEVPHEE